MKKSNSILVLCVFFSFSAFAQVTQPSTSAERHYGLALSDYQQPNSGFIRYYTPTFSTMNVWGFHSHLDQSPSVIGGLHTYFVGQNFDGVFDTEGSNQFSLGLNMVFVPDQLIIGTTNTTRSSFKIKIQNNENIWAHKNGIFINQSNTNDYSYAQLVQTDNNLTKALAVKSASGTEGFRVWGDGSINVTVDNDPASKSTAPIVVNYSDLSIPNTQEVFKVTSAGKVWCTELEVAPIGTFPDYVFEESYQRLSITELHKFITDYGHLPNIPSAKEIDERGSVPVAELQLKILEKVEELSLYVIELEKKNRILEERINQMK